ncbi:MAG: DUF997 family protein [Planctomycetota bacterium]
MRNPKEYELDPVFVNSRREAWIILVVFLIFAVYSLTVCFIYGRQPEDGDLSKLRTFLGMPSWIAFGIVMPWLAANVVTAWFCFSFMSDDPLDEPYEQSAPDWEGEDPNTKSLNAPEEVGAKTEGEQA